MFLIDLSYIQIAGARVKQQDPMSTSSESFIDSRSRHFNNSETMHHSFNTSGGPSNNPQQGNYRDFNVRGQNYNPQHSSYPDFNDRDQYNSRAQHGSYSEFGTQDQYKNPQHVFYPDLKSQPPSYPHNNASQNPYHNATQQQATYQNYQSVSTPQAPYHNISAPNSYQY